ncbi:MAG: GNAT family N-acetyltransferase [Chthoniobacterales bacterium]|nr:MAG: GNAT family N-acetyltransferase [Chthoniobacterales bacterium]
MILHTARLTLRPFDRNDLERMVELFADRDFMRFSGSSGFTREQTTAVLDKFLRWDRDGLPSQFAVIDRVSNTLIGYCGFLHQEVDGDHEIEIGYRFDSRFWNRGLATEAARAVRDHAFRDLKLDRVISLIHPDNHASRRVAQKNGMQVEKETTFKGLPTLVFAMTRQDWLALEGRPPCRPNPSS